MTSHSTVLTGCRDAANVLLMISHRCLTHSSSRADGGVSVIIRRPIMGLMIIISSDRMTEVHFSCNKVFFFLFYRWPWRSYGYLLRLTHKSLITSIINAALVSDLDPTTLSHGMAELTPVSDRESPSCPAKAAKAGGCIGTSTEATHQ